MASAHTGGDGLVPLLHRAALEVPSSESAQEQTSEEELLEAAMARAREEEDAVPKDETMKVRQVEVYFLRHPGQLEDLTRNDGSL